MHDSGPDFRDEVSVGRGGTRSVVLYTITYSGYTSHLVEVSEVALRSFEEYATGGPSNRDRRIRKQYD